MCATNDASIVTKSSSTPTAFALRPLPAHSLCTLFARQIRALPDARRIGSGFFSSIDNMKLGF